MQTREQETIVALATPPGNGGIAVIRLSGDQAIDIVAKGLNIPPKNLVDRRAHHGWIVDHGEPVDEVVVIPFISPGSYTGEDVVEISCHGGVIVSREIISLCVRLGARPASPGEFTERAFLNGKMDLAQAEAVADLIHAQTEASRRAAVYQLEGKLSARLDQIHESLFRLCCLLELELDFGEEDVAFASGDEVRAQMESALETFQDLLSSYRRGRICRNGIRLAIIGKPNVGKSSILNLLTEKERAIVTETAGTTRDILEEQLDIGGVLFRIFDTAGIRKSGDAIEREGVRRAEKIAQEADILLFVLDGSQPITEEDLSIADRIRSWETQRIIVLNKADLTAAVTDPPIPGFFAPVLRLSALTGEGEKRLVDALLETALSGRLPHEGEILLTTERHFYALNHAREKLEHAYNSLNKKMSQEFLAMDIRGALNHIGEITGKTTTDDILDRIFSGFCIGK